MSHHRGGLLVSALDGPLAGSSFTVDRCPRVVRLVRNTAGKADILNLEEDQPEPDETVHWYRWDGKSAGHLCTRGKGCFAMVNLEHAPELRGIRDGGQRELALGDTPQIEQAARDRQLQLLEQ